MKRLFESLMRNDAEGIANMCLHYAMNNEQDLFKQQLHEKYNDLIIRMSFWTHKIESGQAGDLHCINTMPSLMPLCDAEENDVEYVTMSLPTAILVRLMYILNEKLKLNGREADIVQYMRMAYAVLMQFEDDEENSLRIDINQFNYSCNKLLP